MKTQVIATVLASLIAAPGIALAQESAAEATTTETSPTAMPNDGNLPKPASDNDPLPEVASPALPAGGLVKQAGVGGPTGYGRAGVLELGGGMAFSLARDNSIVSVTPRAGYFLADNFQISALLDLSHAKAQENSATIVSGLLEPSYHLPFNRTMFGFVGIGAGASHISDVGTGFTMAPRIGANFMVGRSGVLTPSISYQYTTHDVDMTTNDQAVLAVSSAARFNIGYSVMW